MPEYYFVKMPRGIRVSEAKGLIQDTCECRIKNAARFCFFVKVTSGSLDAICNKAYENGERFIVERSDKVNDSNWDTLRIPGFMKRDRQAGPRRHEGAPRHREGDVVKRPNGRMQKRADEEGPQRPRPENPRPRDEYRVFCLADDYGAVENHLRTTLKAPVKRLETFENKKHAFIIFATIDECRSARAAFRENPLEGVIVRPFIPAYLRNQRRGPRRE